MEEVPVFFDTNTILYLFSKTEQQKRNNALNLISKHSFKYISHQVLNEFSNILFKKFNFSWSYIENLVRGIEPLFSVRSNNLEDLWLTYNIASRYGFSFYDSQILASGILCGCEILYSEDLQDQQLILDQLKVVNPF